ncbi:MAG: hypothetical protein WDO68_18705 [Gammaproteobacteria bacterium]
MMIATTWHRLEPRVRGGDPAVGLRAAVHDPLWLLGRQWQMGELLGEDAAFPVAVRIETEEAALSRFRAGDAGATQPVDYDPSSTPLEVTVEREPPPAPTLRLRLDAWTRLKAALTAAGEADALTTLATAHPLPPPAVSDDTADARLRLLAGPGVGDGLAIAAALSSDPGTLPANAIASFLAWVKAQTPAGAGESWLTDRLEYRFAVGASTSAGEITLAAPEYTGGRLDWHDLDIDPDATHALGVSAAAPVTSVKHLLPTRVRFPGMPAERFWEFEDATVNLGAISAAAEDLGRLVAVEFATVFGNDWWQIPVRATFGSLIGVRSLVVRDSFGENVLIQPTDVAASRRATAPWRMFRQSDSQLAAGAGPAPAQLLVAPVIAGSLEGDPIEQVLLLRDEMANLAWAVERIVEGADGRPRNRSIDYGTRMTAAPAPSLASPADLVYVLQTVVPEHWIPLVPVRDPKNPVPTAAVVLQRGSLLTQDGSMRPITAQGVLLSPQISPWYFHEEEVPSAGLRISRMPAVARWLDGTPYAWTGRRVTAGGGEGSSGLRFDIAVAPTATGS